MTTGGEENKPGCCSLILSKRDQANMCSFFVGPPTALLATPATLNLSDNPDHLLVTDTVWFLQNQQIKPRQGFRKKIKFWRLKDDLKWKAVMNQKICKLYINPLTPKAAKSARRIWY